MILVDTSVWVSHFRRSNPRLEKLLLEEQVYCHPFVIGELACGNLHQRKYILGLLHQLPVAMMAIDLEIFDFIENHRLMGKGLSIIDVHLLASASLSNLSIWTEDKTMLKISQELHLC